MYKRDQNEYYYVSGENSVGRYFFDNGQSSKFGLPKEDQKTEESIFKTTSQKFELATITDPYGVWNGVKSDPELEKIGCEVEEEEEGEGNQKCGNNIIEEGEVCELNDFSCKSDCKSKCAEGQWWNGEECTGLDVKSNKLKYTQEELPTMHVKADGYEKYYIHISNDMGAMGNAEKMQDETKYWQQERTTGTEGDMNFELPNLQLWSNKGKETVTIYYRIDAYRDGKFGALTSIKSFDIDTRCVGSEVWDEEKGVCELQLECTDSPYKLPWPGGKSYYVTQDRQNPVSHNDYYNEWAYDFSLHIGDDVVAVDSGKVIKVVESFVDRDPSVCSDKFANEVNRVSVEHQNGTTIYLHLKQDGVLVREGDIVEKGQVIAHSGNSGYVCGYHLHITNQESNTVNQSTGFGKSIKMDFSDPSVCNEIYKGVPQYYNPKNGTREGFISDNY